MSLRYFFCPSLTWTIKLEPTRKSLVGILNCCKYKLCLRVKTSCQTPFILNIAFQKNLYLVSFQCGLCNESYYDEYVRHFNVRNGDLIKISKLTKNKVMHKGSAVSDHLLLCDHSPSFDSFSALTKQERRFVLQLKESLLIMRNEPSLNRNIRPAPLNLFNRV